MKRIIHFSRYFVPALVFSLILIAVGIAGYVVKDFNKGVDFQPGLLQEVQFAPTALRLGYNGPGYAEVSMDINSVDVVISGSGIEELTHSFPYASYPTLGDIAGGLRGVEGMSVSVQAPSNTNSSLFIQSAQSDSTLESDKPFDIHYLPPDAAPVIIEDVRSSLLPLGTVSVQVLGSPAERRFMIRMEDNDLESESGGVPAEKIIAALEGSFGAGEVAVTRSDYVESRFSKQLSDQAGFLLLMTLALILVYSTIRFKPQFAIGAVLAILHDGLIMIAFVVWTRMEFNTTTIAAILTILGYSINDTIVIFDRVKETKLIYPDDSLASVLNRAISETFSRTVITTFTTMLAVLFLYIFASGSMKDFALALLVGMVSGVYSTIFIACGFVNFWESVALKKSKKRLNVSPAKA